MPSLFLTVMFKFFTLALFQLFKTLLKKLFALLTMGYLPD